MLSTFSIASFLKIHKLLCHLYPWSVQSWFTQAHFIEAFKNYIPRLQVSHSSHVLHPAIPFPIRPPCPIRSLPRHHHNGPMRRSSQPLLIMNFTWLTAPQHNLPGQNYSKFAVELSFRSKYLIFCPRLAPPALCFLLPPTPPTPP